MSKPKIKSLRPPVMAAPVGFPTRPGGPRPCSHKDAYLPSHARNCSEQEARALVKQFPEEVAQFSGMGRFTKAQAAKVDRDIKKFLKIRRKKVAANIGLEVVYRESND